MDARALPVIDIASGRTLAGRKATHTHTYIGIYAYGWIGNSMNI